MPLCELEILAVQSCFRLLVNNLDVKEIIPYLYQTGDVDEYTAMQIQKENRRRTNTMCFLLSTIKKCSFENFLGSLQEDHGFLADKIRHNLNTVVKIYIDSVSPSEAIVHAVHSPHCFKVQKLFNRILRLRDNGEIAAFWNEFQKVEKLWHNRETLPEKTARMTSDLYCMVLVVQYKEIASEGNSDVHNKMLQKFHKVLPHTSDQNRFAIIMLSQKARILSVSDIQNAKSTAEDVMQLSSCYQHGVEAIERNITLSTVTLYDTERNRTRENRKNHVALIMKIRDMISDLDDDCKEDYIETEATAYVMAALTLININEVGKDLGFENLTQEEISQAQKFFSYIEKETVWGILPNRWKAVIFIGKAKLALSENDKERAKSFIEYAKYCSEQVENMPYFLENIKEFESKKFNAVVHCGEKQNAFEGAESEPFRRVEGELEMIYEKKREGEPKMIYE